MRDRELRRELIKCGYAFKDGSLKHLDKNIDGQRSEIRALSNKLIALMELLGVEETVHCGSRLKKGKKEVEFYK
jgi:hypothetical protein